MNIYPNFDINTARKWTFNHSIVHQVVKTLVPVSWRYLIYQYGRKILFLCEIIFDRFFSTYAMWGQHCRGFIWWKPACTVLLSGLKTSCGSNTVPGSLFAIQQCSTLASNYTCYVRCNSHYILFVIIRPNLIYYSHVCLFYPILCSLLSVRGLSSLVFICIYKHIYQMSH